jgi:hypothetical protein
MKKKQTSANSKDQQEIKTLQAAFRRSHTDAEFRARFIAACREQFATQSDNEKEAA